MDTHELERTYDLLIRRNKLETMVLAISNNKINVWAAPEGYPAEPVRPYYDEHFTQEFIAILNKEILRINNELKFRGITV